MRGDNFGVFGPISYGLVAIAQSARTSSVVIGVEKLGKGESLQNKLTSYPALPYRYQP
jgi:hypothetical protein